MKKIILNTLSILMAAAVMVSCTENFKEINEDPNNPTKVPTAYLMTNAQRAIMGQTFYFTTSLYVQHWSETQYTNTSRYETAEASFNGYYTGPLADLQQIINLNTDEETKGEAAASGSNVNQIAVSNILKVLTFQYITDMWGEIPYSEALSGVDNFTPKYDTQDAIYADFLVKLTDAANSIDESGTIDGDIIYGGDMTKWKKFANALKARVALRIGDYATASAALANGFENADDNALFRYLSDADNDNPMWAHFLTRTDYAVSNTMVDFMNQRNDPRLAIYADPNAAGVIRGMPYGVTAAEAGSIVNDSISFPGAAARSATTPGVIMTYAEQLFIQAELEQRAGTDATATYNAAITASMEYWGVDAADIPAYLAHADVAYDPAKFEQLIGEQKWAALYTNGHEAWAEWRRLDWPALTPAPAAVEGRAIPRRRAYTQREYDLNGSNIDEAIARQGADLMDTRMWWDK